jgi:hypothetical protein
MSAHGQLKQSTGIAAAFFFRKTTQRQGQGTRIEGKNRAIGAFFPVRQGFGCLCGENASTGLKMRFLALFALRWEVRQFLPCRAGTRKSPLDFNK